MGDSVHNKEAIELAQACAQEMWSNDKASQALEMSLDEVLPGRATLSMDVNQTMTNGYDICHGGYIFALADSAFAFSCNTYDRVTVAQGCSIEYLRPVRLGDRLCAKGREVKRGRTTGIYDIDIFNQRNELVSIFRGNSFTLDKSILPPQPDSTA